MIEQEIKIAVIGLGYVGLPLAVAFAEHFTVVGFDINKHRIEQLTAHEDITQEVSSAQLQQTDQLTFTAKAADIESANHYIITVPTPVDANNTPDLSPLINASELVGSLLKPGDTVIYESTVYPGATEGVCAKILSSQSDLRLNHDFFLGYSPERINPGDKTNTLSSIVKVVSGSNPATAVKVDDLYKKIIKAGTHVAPTIKVAEAAKAIENTQRDINIAFMNELSMMFHELGIDVLDVIDAAATKWNFLKFTPGLVGGHCIGVDPYYLIHKSQEKGYFPQLITTARRINENMSTYVCERILKLMALKQKHIVSAKVLIMGMTFKENCPDLRNTRVVEIVEQLQNYHAKIEVYDPWVDPEAAKQLEQPMTQNPQTDHYDLVVLAVAHDQFLNSDPRKYLNKGGVLFDLKGLLPEKWVDERL
ncbi:nucleotide sugar dehydrogenase [Marinicella litoralis]|uniref:UDP-N-acetyl-D-galactosamine dehydrogenase n=1 Tax=Marinicella litoralis TaxID=644220 RepID=A0A4R6XYE2_9GAMM|nr:nucleotide sugar dehydrogenase [Marinicella litoralis]TDR23659.1 UDP-N-acetyl-D-galactosamine dehydrogenase [Marinicella litoralis]